MNAQAINQALERLLTITGSKLSRDTAAEQSNNEGVAVAKEAYAFIVNYPVDWNIRQLDDRLINELRQSLRMKYPCLEEQTIRQAGNYFAYLWK